MATAPGEELEAGLPRKLVALDSIAIEHAQRAQPGTGTPEALEVRGRPRRLAPAQDDGGVLDGLGQAGAGVARPDPQDLAVAGPLHVEHEAFELRGLLPPSRRVDSKHDGGDPWLSGRWHRGPIVASQWFQIPSQPPL